MLGQRKAGTTPKQFRDHYENVHMPMMRKLSGDQFPEMHTRYYLQREGSEPFPAAVMMGDQKDFEYDNITIFTYRDKKHFEDNYALFGDEETRKMIAEDEKKFAEKITAVFLGEMCSTEGKKA